jgi:hypothetical protein
MNIININNSGKWCKKCKMPIQEVFIDIKSNANSDIYKIKIEEMMLMCDDCLNNNYKLEILKNEIGEKKDIIKSLNKELLYIYIYNIYILYQKDMLKRFNEKLLNLEWSDYTFFQE